jgi:hypothetical protein
LGPGWTSGINDAGRLAVGVNDLDKAAANGQACARRKFSRSHTVDW